MVLQPPPIPDLPEPWVVTDVADRAILLDQLRRELSPGHSLFGLEASAVARSKACEDVLFYIPAAGSAWVVVHLVWSTGRQRPPWPTFRCFTTPDEWLERFVLPDAHDYD